MLMAIGESSHHREFIIKPSPGSRKTHLIRSLSQHMVKEMRFVTNNHILVQFDGNSVPVKQDGLISEEDRDEID